ncbi:MAG: hypothetical protein H7829_18795 [Magnetococcus sp. THC-1_WYH]
MSEVQSLIHLLTHSVQSGEWIDEDLMRHARMLVADRITNEIERVISFLSANEGIDAQEKEFMADEKDYLKKQSVAAWGLDMGVFAGTKPSPNAKPKKSEK